MHRFMPPLLASLRKPPRSTDQSLNGSLHDLSETQRSRLRSRLPIKRHVQSPGLRSSTAAVALKSRRPISGQSLIADPTPCETELPFAVRCIGCLIVG